jgi:hypothetical protein
MSDIGKETSRIIELDEIAYSELILSIDVKTNSSKTAFNIVEACKTKDRPDDNAAAWERLSAPTLVKFEKQFREFSLKKGQDPQTRITELKDLCLRIENMESSILENQTIPII